MFCRHGGVSSAPFASLNLSHHVGDKVDAVNTNRSIISRIVQIKHLCSAHQVHSDRVATIHSKQNVYEIDGIDALITNLH